MFVIGIMSGSSLDGIDIACVEFSGLPELSWRLVKAETNAMPDDLIARLGVLPQQSAQSIADTEYHFSVHLASALNAFLSDLDVEPGCAGIHGHTVLHSPSIQKSWQLLNPGLVAARCGLDVIHDFRCQDMALGGMGTPMAVIADRDLFPGYDYYLNLGGIANISYRKGSKWRAYDLAPFNQLHNYFAQKRGQAFDQDGTLAAEGQYEESLGLMWNEHHFIRKLPPKALDNTEVYREWIQPAEMQKLPPEAIMHSFSRFLAAHIAQLVLVNPGKILVTGGGAYNRFFIELLNKELKGLGNIVIPDAELINYKEAILMAYMAYLRYHEAANFIPEASGASSKLSSGGLYLGKLKRTKH